MTPPSRRSTFRDLALVAAAALGVGWPARAAAQACCAGGALVNPTRLAPYEDASAGVQLRARAAFGSFGASGQFTASRTEQELEQDLAGSFRIARRAQGGVVLPFVETRRVESGQASTGSGLGDLALTGRYDFALASEMLYWPGFALVGSLIFPTGKAAGSGTNAAGTDATGTGTLNASLGAAFEKIHGALYFDVQAWVTYSRDRTVDTPGFGSTTTSFPLQLTALGVVGLVFDSEAALAAYVSFLDRGDTSLNGAAQPGTELRLTTAGLSGLLPIGERWRLQGTLYGDVPLDHFGRNEQASGGVTVALVRLWM
ncbi:MAG TPA: hypothetical protein VLT58_11545 [Polyangia bacterium]|nr:hypothetical protein [Polyangia bacterium]